MNDSLREKNSSFEKPEIPTVRRIWPLYLYNLHSAFEYPSIWLTLNMVVISNIIWPGDIIHTKDIALIFGLCYIFGAFSRLTSGYLADRYSRIKLFGITTMGASFCFFLYGFMPLGLGRITFYYILVITILRELFTGQGTIIPSFLDDAVEEKKRSQIFGKLILLEQLMYIVASLIASFFFRYIWKEFFFIVGLSGVLIGFVILIKGKEPKRGSERQELKRLLKLEEVEYKYNLNRETIKSTLFSKTNLIILFEGICTQIVMIVPYILLIGYLQSPPYNFSPIIFAFLGILFGGPGTIIGSVVLSKRIDKSAEKNIKNRIKFIFFSLVFSYLVWLLIILLPYREGSPSEGENFLLFLSNPIHLISGLFYFLGYLLSAIFVVSQSPLIQKLNLPEAQGTISSINNFFEILSIGIGSILAGIILSLFNNNFQMTVVVIMIIGMVGAMLWLLTLKTIDKDIERVSGILNQRSEEIRRNNN